MANKTININVPVLARVEGEGALELKISNQHIDELRLRIYEPPRYFEKFLEGRDYYDLPDTVARICGICPVAYQMSAIHAIDAIFDIKATGWIREMRRLMYCGEWLQSHSLHIHMLAVPDFLGFNNVIEMAAVYPGEVNRGLRLQSLGNDLISLLGARSVHPLGVRTGGFYKAPATAAAHELLQRLKIALADAVDLVKWTTALELPDDNQDFTSVALRHTEEYPLNEGRLVSDKGLDIGIAEYQQHFKESHIPHSTALHSLLDGKPYLVGPLARLNINHDKLPAETLALVEQLNIRFPSNNMFHSIIARAIEIHFVIIEAIRILENYQKPESAFIDAPVKAGVGYGCTEAPRGILWHRYELDNAGKITSAIIIPPTSQNQARIEEDIKVSLESLGLDKNEDVLRLHAEKVIRNYDPCISCATHFLKLDLQRAEVHVTQAASLDKKAIRRIKVIGIGSPFGEDKLGWDIVDLLIQDTSRIWNSDRELTFHILDRPGPLLLEHLKNTDKVILVDAIHNTRHTHNLIRIGIDQLDQAGTLISSHGLGIKESLLLAKTLGQLPETIILGIEASIDMTTQEMESCKEKLIETIKQELD